MDDRPILVKLGIASLLLVSIPFLYGTAPSEGFKEEQMRYPRVREAYEKKEEKMVEILEKEGVDRGSLRLHIRAYKKEEVVELWGRNASERSYRKLRSYDFCASSGELGPKRQQGDRQIPEGFYRIDRFNPASRYHLSLGVNYPNFSDRKLGVQGDLGGNIFIHGNCVTIGCIPITDPFIRELYIFCVEAKDRGQDEIKVRFFPAKSNKMSLQSLSERKNDAPEELWEELLKADSIFRSGHVPAQVDFLQNGRHRVQDPS